MTPLAELPDWAAVTVSLLVLLGAFTTLIGAIGLVRLRTFYERVHPPTLGSTLGTASIVLASMICFSVLGSRPVLHEILILVFVTLTTPITLVMLTRAAVYRDRAEGNDPVQRSRPDS